MDLSMSTLLVSDADSFFFIYLTQWSIDLDDLLIQNEWLDIGAAFLLDDLVLSKMLDCIIIQVMF